MYSISTIYDSLSIVICRVMLHGTSSFHIGSFFFGVGKLLLLLRPLKKWTVAVVVLYYNPANCRFNSDFIKRIIYNILLISWLSRKIKAILFCIRTFVFSVWVCPWRKHYNMSHSGLPILETSKLLQGLNQKRM